MGRACRHILSLGEETFPVGPAEGVLWVTAVRPRDHRVRQPTPLPFQIRVRTLSSRWARVLAEVPTDKKKLSV